MTISVNHNRGQTEVLTGSLPNWFTYCVYVIRDFFFFWGGVSKIPGRIHSISKLTEGYFSQFQDTTDALPCHIHLPVCLWIIDPHSRAPYKNTSHGNEVLPQDVTNEEVRAKIQQAIGPHKDLTIVKRRRLQWYGHLSRSSVLAKTILQGTVKGGRKQGRQKKRWEGNIRDWTGLELAKFQWAVENRENGGHWLWTHLRCPSDPRG